MAQYRTGVVSVTNGSAIVTGVGTKFLSNVAVGHLFSLQNSWVAYEIASVDTDEQITLTVPYADVDADNQYYMVVNDFTANFDLPLPNSGDVDISYIFRRALVKVDEIVSVVSTASAAATAAASDAAAAAAAAEATAAAAGDVTGPAVATDGALALFDTTTGKKLKNSTYTPASFASTAHNHAAADISDSSSIGRSILTAATAAAILTLLSAASTSYVDTKVATLVNSAPAALDTLNELATALGNDANFATTMTTALAAKLNSSSYTAADVLTKLLTVDGAASGLDADLLDGVQGANYVRKNADNTLLSGFDASVVESGTIATGGSYTPSYVGGNFFHIPNNNGAFALNAPTIGNQYTLVGLINNGPSAGVVTMSGFTKVSGAAFTTTNAAKFLVFITRIYGLSYANVVAL